MELESQTQEKFSFSKILSNIFTRPYFSFMKNFRLSECISWISVNYQLSARHEFNLRSLISKEVFDDIENFICLKWIKFQHRGGIGKYTKYFNQKNQINWLFTVCDHLMCVRYIYVCILMPKGYGIPSFPNIFFLKEAYFNNITIQVKVRAIYPYLLTLSRNAEEGSCKQASIKSLLRKGPTIFVPKNRFRYTKSKENKLHPWNGDSNTNMYRSST